MKPAEFRYERPSSLQDALVLMAEAGTDVAVLAGGQSLMPMLNFRVSQPELLVDLGDIAELSGISREGGQVRIGAMTRYAAALADADLLAAVPLLARALPHVAHPAIRNRGTLGGSIALADPAAELPAVMLALGATIHLAAAGGTRSVAAGDFFRGYYDTARAEDEILTALDLPAAAPGDAFGFHEVARRHGDYAMAGVCIARRGGMPAIAFFAVADRPVRARAAEAVLAEDPQALSAAVAALAEIDFAGDLNAGPEMKRHLAGVVLRRAWADLTTQKTAEAMA